MFTKPLHRKLKIEQNIYLFHYCFKTCVGHGRILFTTLKCFGKSYHIPLINNVYKRHLYAKVFTLDYNSLVAVVVIDARQYLLIQQYDYDQ